MRDLLQYLGVRFGVGLVGLLPRRLAVSLGTFAGRMSPRLVPGRRSMVIRHARRLGVTETAMARHVRDVFGFYGRYWAEAFWTRRRRRAQIEASTRVVGLDTVESVMAGGSGMVFAVPHVGNWEFAGPVASGIGLRLVAVAEKLANRRIRQWFVGLRAAMDIEILFSGPAVLRQLEDVVEGGGAVALVCDRDLRGRGVTVEFLGERTTLPAGPVRLALSTGVPLIPVAVYFGGIGHRVVIDDPLDLSDLTGERPDRDHVAAGTQRMATALGRLICAAPEQWHMLQPNWPSDRMAVEA